MDEPVPMRSENHRLHDAAPLLDQRRRRTIDSATASCSLPDAEDRYGARVPGLVGVVVLGLVVLVGRSPMRVMCANRAVSDRAGHRPTSPRRDDRI